MPYIGRSTEAFGVRTRYTYTPSAGDTSVSGADVNGLSLSFTDGAYVDVFLNGVRLKHNTDYVTTTANTIGSLAALAASDEVEVIVYDVFSLADMVSSANGGNFFNQVNFKTDSAVVAFGADNDVTLTHVADTGLKLKNTSTSGNSGVGAILTLQTGETDIAQDDVLGQIDFQAPDEGTGTDAILKSASIQAVSEGDFSSSFNRTSLVFNTARSAAVGSAGDGGRLTLKSNGSMILKDMRTDANAPSFILQTGSTNVAQDGILGVIEFQAPDEGTGTDAILVAAGIAAISEGDFSSSSNATKLSFKTGSSEAAAEKMSLSSVGQLKVQNEVDNNYIAEFQNTEATDGRSFGMRIKAGSNASDQSFVIQDHDASNTLFKITGDGDVNIGIGDILFGTSGKGINLGVTSNTDSNTLDDYEEGTWSGTLRAVAGSAGTVAGNTSTAHYLKVGNAINILFTCNMTNLGSYTANANVAVYGLPFTAGGYVNHPLTLGFHDFHSDSTTRNICVQVTANQAYVYHANPDSSITLWNEIGTGLYSFNGFYRTDF